MFQVSLEPQIICSIFAILLLYLQLQLWISWHLTISAFVGFSPHIKTMAFSTPIVILLGSLSRIFGVTFLAMFILNPEINNLIWGYGLLAVHLFSLNHMKAKVLSLTLQFTKFLEKIKTAPKTEETTELNKEKE
jgi:hypothetical protein